MLRILMFLIVVLAAVLAVILQDPVFYGGAAVLLAVSATVLMVSFFRKKEKAALREQPKDELESLGIIEIRPRGTAPTRPEQSETEAASETTRADASAPPVETAPVSTFGVSPPTVKKKTVAEVSATDPRLKKDFLLAYLQAVQSAIGANTVCLLREEQPQKYNIEGVVSKNSYARNQGLFSSKVSLAPPAKSRKAVHLLRIGEKGIPTSGLGYYLEPIAVRQVAVARVPLPSEPATWYLLCDTMEEGGLGTKRQSALLSQFAALVGTMLDFRDTSDEEEDTEVEVPEVRPRRDIIAEEMRTARSEQRDLGLMLVHLNRAEPVAEMGEQAVLDAEARLDACLREAAQGTPAARIERFGELTFGIFYHGEVSGVETWADQLQQRLAGEEGLLEGGVSIGAAMMRERHEGPDALRADATEALSAAYETGACTILE
jgi:GGDEF domain-containing protein